MATKKKTRKAPDKQAVSGRDDETGQFLPGHSGNPKGRPRGYDFRKIVAEHVARSGDTVEAVVARLFDRLDALSEGKGMPAIAAAREILSRLVEADPTKLDVAHSGAIAGPPVPTEEQMARDIIRAEEIARKALRACGKG